MTCSSCGKELLNFESESDPDGLCFPCRMKIIIAKNRAEEIALQSSSTITEDSKHE